MVKQLPFLRSFLLGTAAFCIYYAIITRPFFHGTILHQYTTEHVTEFVITALFLWSATDHLFCCLATRREVRACKQKWLTDQSGVHAPTRADDLLVQIQKHEREYGDTMIYQRIRAALRFVSKRRSVEEFREYLDSLTARDADYIHDRYGFSRFVTAILPIIGLIGTVVHFGTALNGLSMEALDERLPELLSSMGTAFNTTCAAMSALSITLLVRFLLERQDLNLVRWIDHYIEDELLHRFKTIDSSLKPFVDALKESQELTLEAFHNSVRELQLEAEKRTEHYVTSLMHADHKQQENLVHFLGAFEQRQMSHTRESKQLSDNLIATQHVLTSLTELLSGDSKLLELQEKLANNMLLLQQSEKFESAVHELTAAVHLLTARQASLNIRNAA